MREAMDNYLNSLLSSTSWSDMNESVSRSWVESCTSQTDCLLGDSMESFHGDRNNLSVSVMPSSSITRSVTDDILDVAHDDTSSLFSDGGLKYGTKEGPFLTGNLLQRQQTNLKLQPSHGIEASEGGFSIPNTATCNSASIPRGLELSSSQTHSALSNPSSLESSGSEPTTYGHSVGEAHSISWPASYSGISSLGGQVKAENISFQGISTGVDLLMANQNELCSNLDTFSSGQQMKMTGANSPPHYQTTTEVTNLQLPSSSGVPQMSKAGIQINPQFDGPLLQQQLDQSSNSHQEMAQTNGVVGSNVAAKPRVRARRGEATDPHSIAERVRREKISERMKKLQELVPNSNKTDKASMLDEIIDYVKFLQLQVKVLSMSRLGAAGAVVPLITDVQAEDSGSMNMSTINQVVDVLDSEENLALEREVVKLMESSLTDAMQYLQNKGFCLMPIALASAISNQKGSSAATPLDQRKQKCK